MKFDPTQTRRIERPNKEIKLIPIICSWCNTLIRITEGEYEENKKIYVSHGICRDCYDIVIKQLDGN